jgi:hypothetical protein
MNLSMNQQYKAAKTNMPFKDWIEWRKTLERKSDSFFNTDGDTPQTVKERNRKQILMVTVPLLVIGLGMAIYGVLKEK